MSNTSNAAAESRLRKRKAVLAGGVVLGLGATMTLAAWTDDVWVSGSFSAGKFNVQGSVDAGATWNEYNTSGSAGTLPFTVPVTAMSPGDSVFAPLHLRVDPSANSYNAAITVPTAPTGPAVVNTANTAFFGALRVTLYNVAPGSCTSGGTASATALSGFNNVALGTTTTSTLITLDKSSTPQVVCFKVTLPSGSPTTVQGGTTGALTWNFNATSV
ncbi:SipW-dependent-type signal peptide-containing protein [Dietzia sp. PP-33]|jgi:predicted ribosomally synthesized peptide with SipW-like signal peptide|uniref:SipW-dependent-type signal peptide-containing protein n=1 Tax=Dietzia sp. PP-33 TaxID=2957500 RepID=UPI0029A32F1A|nr:SipW-dependent-type signal peptide-containing protein [Dietzia sp. PP-33]MDX2356182.1 SipW-dependent-type signal peptide-containing protein [Dietzia sp. PP-33]